MKYLNLTNFQIFFILWIIIKFGYATKSKNYFGLDQVNNYLMEFGYLPKSDIETGNLRTEAQLKEAVKSLQRFGNVPITGEIDESTMKLMKRPRCGVPDQPEALDFSSDNRQFLNSSTRVKRFVLQGPKWEHTVLTWSLVNQTMDDLDSGQVRRTLSEALDVWSKNSKLRFQEINSEQADIQVLFASRHHGDGYNFDGPGLVLAHAFYPGEGRGGDAHFDADESWTTNLLEVPDGADLFGVAVHEFGHSLGLGHSSVEDAIMFPWYKGYDQTKGLPEDDRRGIQYLYPSREKQWGSNPYRPKLTTTTTTTTTTTAEPMTFKPRFVTKPRFPTNDIPRSDEPHRDEPRNDDPRYKDPRNNDPRQHDPRQHDPRQHDPRQNDPRHNDPRHNDPRHNDPRHNDPRHNDPRHNDPRHNDPRYTDPRHNDPRHNDPRHNDPRHNNPRHNDPRSDNPSPNDPRPNDPRQEDPRQSDPRYNDPKHNDPGYDDPRYNDPRQNDPRYNDPRYNDPRYNDPRYNDPRYNDPRLNDPRYNDPRHNDPRNNDPRHNDPRQNDPRPDDPKHNDPRHDDPRHNDPRYDPRYPSNSPPAVDPRHEETTRYFHQHHHHKTTPTPKMHRPRPVTERPERRNRPPQTPHTYPTTKFPHHPHIDRSKPDGCDMNFDSISMIRGELFIFKDKYLWRIGERGLYSGYPHETRRLWNQLPENLTHVDAVYENRDRKIIFFIGRQYYVFNSNMLERGYPKPITELGLPESMDKIDAALVWGYNNRTYFYGNTMYYRFDEEVGKVELDYPRDMSIWQGIGYHIDCAFQYTNGKTYFFKGKNFWEFDDNRMRVSHVHPKPNHKWLRCSRAHENDRKHQSTSSQQKLQLSASNSINSYKNIFTLGIALILSLIISY